MNRKKSVFILMICLFLSLGIAASAAVYKDEVVFVSLNEEGQPLVAYVINAFEADEPSEVTDRGQYESVQPLGDADGFAYADNQVKFTMPTGRFSYQGNLKQTDLPWVFDMSYTLDGKAVTAGDLSGASGKLEATLRVSVNDSLRAFADSLSLQITVTFDGARALNIQAEKATYALSGGSRTLSFVVLPGQSAEYTFTCDAQNFMMEDVQIAAVRIGMDTQMYQQVAADSLAGSPLEGAVSGLMGNLMTQMQGRPLRSFTDDENQVRALQFVMMLRGIKAPEPADKP
ncbi:MAG TPA: hypothetical protein GX006_04185 [Clostridiales bacterium]|jgi:hypothetical protein|nr:hypothetical protein [Clostridiales bacterium]